MGERLKNSFMAAAAEVGLGSDEAAAIIFRRSEPPALESRKQSVVGEQTCAASDFKTCAFARASGPLFCHTFRRWVIFFRQRFIAEGWQNGYCTGLENQRPKGLGGSSPSPSASVKKFPRTESRPPPLKEALAASAFSPEIVGRGQGGF